MCNNVFCEASGSNFSSVHSKSLCWDFRSHFGVLNCLLILNQQLSGLLYKGILCYRAIFLGLFPYFKNPHNFSYTTACITPKLCSLLLYVLSLGRMPSNTNIFPTPHAGHPVSHADNYPGRKRRLMDWEEQIDAYESLFIIYITYTNLSIRFYQSQS